MQRPMQTITLDGRNIASQKRRVESFQRDPRGAAERVLAAEQKRQRRRERNLRILAKSA